MGVGIVAVSPDRPSKLTETVSANDLNYTLLSDSSMAGAKMLGIAERFSAVKVAAYKLNNQNIETASGQDHHLIPVPSLYIIDRDGSIKFSQTDNNHRKRISAEEILRISKEILN